MSLPFDPITLTFSDLHYLVPLPPQQADSPNAVTGPNGQKELELLRVSCLPPTYLPSNMGSAKVTAVQLSPSS